MAERKPMMAGSLMVVAGTLLIQGLTLPWLTRKHGPFEVAITIRAKRLPVGVFPLNQAPGWLQGFLYAALGLLWVLPAMLIIRWMETGRLRR